MPRRIRLVPHLADDLLEARYRLARDPVERSHWHFLWLLAGGMTATAVTAVTGYSAYWIGQVARRYNYDGPVSVHDRRHRAGERRLLLPVEQHGALCDAVGSAHPEGDRWCGRTAAAWIGARWTQGLPTDRLALPAAARCPLAATATAPRAGRPGSPG